MKKTQLEISKWHIGGNSRIKARISGKNIVLHKEGFFPGKGSYFMYKNEGYLPKNMKNMTDGLISM